MVILMIAFSGCSKADDPIVDNGDNPDNPSNPGNTNPSYKSDFTKKVFNSPEEIQAFIPAGIYGESNTFVAFGTDGSFTSNFLSTMPEATVCLNKGAEVHNVLYEADRSMWVRQDYYDVPTTGGVYENEAYYLMSIATNLLTMFITSSDCEKAPTNVYDDNVAGAAVKHYVYKSESYGIISSSEYWVTSKGVCLKYQLSAGTTDNPTMSVITDAITLLNTNVGDFKDILGKLPQLDKAPGLIPGFDNLYVMTYKKYATKWLSDQYPRTLDKWIIPYSASGTIDYMEVWHDPQVSVYEGWTNIYVSVTTTNHQDILDYVNSVMKIEKMKQNEFVDQNYSGVNMFSFKGDNSDIVVKSGDNYISYEVGGLLNNTYLIHIRLMFLYFV